MSSYVEYDLADVEGIVTKAASVPKRFKAEFQIRMPVDYNEPELTPIISVETRAGASAIRRWFAKVGCRNVHVYLDIFEKVRPLWIVEFYEKQ